MESPEKSHTIILSDKSGWIIPYTFFFLLLILAGVFSTLSIARFKIISGRGFEKVLKNDDAFGS
jgi:hypothetical protein